MELRPLGRTGLEVSALGLGCGGPSKLGLGSGNSLAQAADLIRCAIDGGINLLDTARAYGTEPVIAEALKNGLVREQIVICSKFVINRKGERLRSTDLRQAIDESLRSLATDRIDIYMLHAVLPEDYAFAVAEHLQPLVEAREAGKIGHIGISERFTQDPQHQTLGQALRDDYWDVLMPGYSPASRGVEHELLPLAQQSGRGVIAMYSLRDSKQWLSGARLDRARQCWGDDITPADLAYAFCAGHTAVHSVLTGTGNAKHLQQNIAGFNRLASLRQEIVKELK